MLVGFCCVNCCVRLQCSEVHAPRRNEATGEHAHAMGANTRRQILVPHHRSHNVRQ